MRPGTSDTRTQPKPSRVVTRGALPNPVTCAKTATPRPETNGGRIPSQPGGGVENGSSSAPSLVIRERVEEIPLGPLRLVVFVDLFLVAHREGPERIFPVRHFE